jgi:hypothetical protein
VFPRQRTEGIHVTPRQKRHAPDFTLLLSESGESHPEHTRAKRNNQFAAIVHLPT